MSQSPSPSSAPLLAAVVFTDVVGYSARMQQDAQDTIRLVAADLAQMRARCEALGGRCLNTMGDGMMLAFASVTDAVRFALDVQTGFAARRELPSGLNGLQHRIGIHLGDVFTLESGQLAGDGVNIAARLEAAAPPGGICISQSAYDIVKGKMPMQAEFAGRSSFKNIAEPIAVWHLRPAAEVGPRARLVRLGPAGRRRSLLVAGAASAIAGAGAIWWAGPWRLPLSARDASVAVLPFANLSDDKGASYFADGVHEDLLTQLALLRELKVVSRTSVMEYRGRSGNIRQIGAELGVASIVEGSVRRAGDLVRVTAQLVDARSDRQVWARHFDRELKNVFALQSELAAEIVRALRVTLSPAERERMSRARAQNIEAYDLFLRHQAMLNSAFGVRTVGTVRERIQLVERAVTLDPGFALAWARLASDHARAFSFGIDPTEKRREQARATLQRALELAPAEPLVRLEEGYVAMQAFDDLAAANRAYQAVLDVAPGHAEALYGLSRVQWELARADRAIALLERAFAVDPRNPQVLWALARIHTEYRHYEKGQAFRRRMLEIRPDDEELARAYALVEFWRTGSLEAYDKTLATALAPSVQRWQGVRWMEVRRAIARRDFGQVLRLLETLSTDMRAAESVAIAEDNQLTTVLAHLAAGNTATARRLARSMLVAASRAASDRPTDETPLEAQAQLHAVLGEREAAWDAHARAVAVVERRGRPMATQMVRNGSLEIHALLGDKDQALAEFAIQARRPGWVHERKLNLALASLFDHPRFRAVVDDPESNAPLPLDMRPDGTRGGG